MGVNAALDRLCDTALARDVDKRFRTAADMAAALEKALRSLPPSRQPSVGSASDVAAYFHSQHGEDLAAQRDTIRHWLEQRARHPVDLRAARAWPARTQLLGSGGESPRRREIPAPPSVTPVMNPQGLQALEGADTEDGETRLLRLADDEESTAKGPGHGGLEGAHEARDASGQLVPLVKPFVDTDRELTAFYDGGTDGASAVPLPAEEPRKSFLLTPLVAVVVGFALGLVLLAFLLHYPPSILRGPPPSPSDVRR
jgi:serine/threonine-protein kinase